MSKINWENISFNIITQAGDAKSCAMESMSFSRNNEFKKAKEKIENAEKAIAIASHLHMDIITEEAKGNNLEYKVLFLHAEDQLLTTQTIIIFAREIMHLYQKINIMHKK